MDWKETRVEVGCRLEAVAGYSNKGGGGGNEGDLLKDRQSTDIYYPGLLYVECSLKDHVPEEL